MYSMGIYRELLNSSLNRHGCHNIIQYLTKFVNIHYRCADTYWHNDRDRARMPAYA